MLLPMNDKLTNTNPVDGPRSQTHAGMAHFAGTGPDGETCRLCEHWKPFVGSHEYYASGGKHRGQIKPHACQKFRMMTGTGGPGVPHNASACKYFYKAERPAPIHDPRR